MLQLCNSYWQRWKFVSLLTLEVFHLLCWSVTETLTIWHNLRHEHRTYFCCLHNIFVFISLFLVWIIGLVLHSMVFSLGVSERELAYWMEVCNGAVQVPWSLNRCSELPGYVYCLLLSLICYELPLSCPVLYGKLFLMHNVYWQL